MKDVDVRAFIVGMPRAGTTYLSKILDQHSEICSVGESLFWGRNFQPPKNEGYTKNQLDSILDDFKYRNWEPLLIDTEKKQFQNYLEEGFSKLKETKITPYDPFQILANSFCKVKNKEVFIEKTPHHIQWIDRILEFFPNAKFIVTIRDPYEFMLSYKFQGSQKKDEIKSIFERIYHPIGTALVWKKNFQEIEKSRIKLKDQTILVNTNEINKPDTINNIFEFLSVKPERLFLEKDNSSFKRLKIKPTLDKVDLFWMNIIAGKEIKYFNGELRRSQVEFLSVVISIFRIPKIFYRLYQQLPVNKGQNKIAYLLNYLK